jgi:hypothetical protein
VRNTSKSNVFKSSKVLFKAYLEELHCRQSKPLPLSLKWLKSTKRPGRYDSDYADGAALA